MYLHFLADKYDAEWHFLADKFEAKWRFFVDNALKPVKWSDTSCD